MHLLDNKVFYSSLMHGTNMKITVCKNLETYFFRWNVHLTLILQYATHFYHLTNFYTGSIHLSVMPSRPFHFPYNPSSLTFVTLSPNCKPSRKILRYIA